MKGIIAKRLNSWDVRYFVEDKNDARIGVWKSLPIHPDDKRALNTYKIDELEGKEVEFEEQEIYIGQHGNGFNKVGLQKFAKLILPTKRPIDYLDECIKSSPQMVKENSSVPTKAPESSWDDIKEELIAAWDSIPMGNYPPNVIAKWLKDKMAPAIDKLRNHPPLKR